MSYLHQATTDPYAFSIWPDAAASSEEMMVWARAARYAQPGRTVENFSLDDLDATIAWGQSSPTETYGSQRLSVSTFAFGI